MADDAEEAGQICFDIAGAAAVEIAIFEAGIDGVGPVGGIRDRIRVAHEDEIDVAVVDALARRGGDEVQLLDVGRVKVRPFLRRPSGSTEDGGGIVHQRPIGDGRVGRDADQLRKQLDDSLHRTGLIASCQTFAWTSS